MKEIIEKTEIKISSGPLLPQASPLFFDIETTGLKKETTQIYLIGCGYEENGRLIVRQWLAQDLSEEEAVLRAFFEFASAFSLLVHFNGERFDIPYVRFRASVYGLENPLDQMQGFDIYRQLKPAKALMGLERMSQRSVEHFMHIKREDTMSGGDLIPVFYEYARLKNAEAERLLLLHNFCDVEGMAGLLPALSYAGIINGGFTFESAEDTGEVLSLRYHLNEEVPFPVSSRTKEILLWADADTLGMDIKIYEGELVKQIPNYKDYYYLPEEDMIVHKDVAQFVDKEFRQKATAKNCVVKKSGRFIPALVPDKNMDYILQKNNEKPAYYIDITKIIHAKADKFLQYAMDFFGIM